MFVKPLDDSLAWPFDKDDEIWGFAEWTEDCRKDRGICDFSYLASCQEIMPFWRHGLGRLVCRAGCWYWELTFTGDGCVD